MFMGKCGMVLCANSKFQVNRTRDFKKLNSEKTMENNPQN